MGMGTLKRTKSKVFNKLHKLRSVSDHMASEYSKYSAQVIWILFMGQICYFWSSTAHSLNLKKEQREHSD